MCAISGHISRSPVSMEWYSLTIVSLALLISTQSNTPKRLEHYYRAYTWSKAFNSWFNNRKGGAVVRDSARLPPMWPGFKSRPPRHMWVEFVVGSLLCSERFFSGYSGFPPSSKTNTSKSNLIWNARTRLNEFIWTLKCFVGKKAIYIFF